MPKGGRRKGAGRPRGSLNKVTEEARAFAQARLDATLAALEKLARHAESENVQLASIKEMLYTAIGKPRTSAEQEPEPAKTVHIVRTYRWARDESEATFDPARERMRKLAAQRAVAGTDALMKERAPSTALPARPKETR